MKQTQQTPKIPENWEIKKLGEFIELIKGKKPNKFVGKEVNDAKPYILISSFGNIQEYYTNDKNANTKPNP